MNFWKKNKLPTVMQMEALECGAASLAMILAYYEKWVPLEQLRVDCGVSRDGSNAKNILRAARLYGLEAKGYKYEIDTLKKVETPCIIHWNFGHFVVFNGFSGNKALINDPGRGALKISFEEFDMSYTGICLCFSPTEKFEKGGKRKSILGFVFKKLDGMLLPFVFITFCGIIVAIIGIVNPTFSKIFMDQILTSKSKELLSPLLFVMILTVMLQIFVSIVNILYIFKIRAKFEIVSSSSFMWHVLRLPIEFFMQRMPGDISSRLSSNEKISETLVNELLPIGMNFSMLFFYLFVMYKHSSTLTLLGLTGIILNLSVNNFITKKRVNIMRVQMRDKANLLNSTLSGIEMIESIKSSGSESGFFELWAGYQALVKNSETKNFILNSYVGVIPGAIQQCTSLFILAVGAIQIINGEITSGVLIAFQSLMTHVTTPVSKLYSTTEKTQELFTYVERIEDVMNYKPDVSYERDLAEINKDLGKLSGNLEIKNLTYGYSKIDAPLIKNFNLTLTQGSRIAIVGSSGCGKSTIAKLISGLIKPWSGEILFDGKAIGEITHEVFTDSLAVVDQEITMFEDTVRNNIKMWDKSIEDFEMILAARDAIIHEDILLRENGFDHKILEGGRNFSGGQKQRIEIARVLSQDPTIIILDEATSALDAKTEYKLVESIKNRGITCIIIAHRLSTIRDCDQIFVLEEGETVEFGTHEELLSKNGFYTKLVTME